MAETPDIAETPASDLSTSKKNGAQPNGTERPWPVLVPVYELCVIYPSGSGGDVWRHPSLESAVDHASRLRHSTWRVRHWLETPAETIITWSHTRVTADPAEAPDPSVVRRVEMEPPETGQEPPDSPQTGQETAD